MITNYYKSQDLDDGGRDLDDTFYP
jgi:hypothetical protein